MVEKPKLDTLEFTLRSIHILARAIMRLLSWTDTSMKAGRILRMIQRFQSALESLLA
jgi:hypothetical protein